MTALVETWLASSDTLANYEARSYTSGQYTTGILTWLAGVEFLDGAAQAVQAVDA